MAGPVATGAPVVDRQFLCCKPLVLVVARLWATDGRPGAAFRLQDELRSPCRPRRRRCGCGWLSWRMLSRQSSPFCASPSHTPESFSWCPAPLVPMEHQHGAANQRGRHHGMKSAILAVRRTAPLSNSVRDDTCLLPSDARQMLVHPTQ